MAKKTETATEAPAKKISRSEAANRVILEMGDKSTLGELAAKADALFVEGGGESKLKAATVHVRRALETLEAVGVLKLTKPTDVMVQRVKAGK